MRSFSLSYAAIFSIVILSNLCSSLPTDDKSCGKKVYHKIHSNDEDFPMVAKIYEKRKSLDNEIIEKFMCNAVIVDKMKVVANKNCGLCVHPKNIIVKFKVPASGNEGISITVEKIKYYDADVQLNKLHLDEVYVLELSQRIPDELFYFSHCFKQYFRQKNKLKIYRESDENRCKRIEKFLSSDRFDKKIIEMAFKLSNGREINEGAFYTRVDSDWFLYGLYFQHSSYDCTKLNGNSIFKDLERFFKCSKKSVTKISGALANQIYCPGDVIFQENFNKIDKNKWKYENTLSGSDDKEFQWYTDDPRNSLILDGNLHIRSTLTNDTGVNIEHGVAQINDEICTDRGKINTGCRKEGRHQTINPIRSASLSTINSFSFTHAEVEIRAKVAAGDWLTSQVSLNNPTTSETHTGQMVILESIGNRKYEVNGTNIGVNLATSRIRFEELFKLPPKNWKNENGFHKDFHIYKFRWTPGKIVFSVDGDEKSIEYMKELRDCHCATKKSAFEDQFYLTISLKSGGALFYPDSGDFINSIYQKPWTNAEPDPAKSFWNSREFWLKTWIDDERDLVIDYVKITAV